MGYIKLTNIIALRNEKGSYNLDTRIVLSDQIIALRNEKGSYNADAKEAMLAEIIALRNEKGSYNENERLKQLWEIIALRNEKGFQSTLYCKQAVKIDRLLFFIICLLYKKGNSKRQN